MNDQQPVSTDPNVIIDALAQRLAATHRELAIAEAAVVALRQQLEARPVEG